MTRHTCHALGCNAAVPRRLFMCRTHWYMLTNEERRAVWALYTPGQENDWSKVTPEYLDAIVRIIQDLAARTGVEAE